MATKIRQSIRDCRLWLLDLYEREGWRALGYSSWRECCAAEFEQNERQLYYLLQAAQVDRDLQRAAIPIPAGGIPTRQAAELARLPTAELRRQVYAEAAQDGEISAEKIAGIVDREERQSSCEKSRNVNDQAERDGTASRKEQPKAAKIDPVDVIVQHAEEARRLHASLGRRSRAADRAIDEYLRVVRG